MKHRTIGRSGTKVSEIIFGAGAVGGILIHEGKYVAEVEVESIETDDEWSPYLSLAEAGKLDDVREALRNNVEDPHPTRSGRITKTMNYQSRLVGPLLCSAVWVCAVPNAAAQSAYPSKPVQIIVPYTAGGGADVIVRAVAQRLAQTWGRNVVIDNRAGASGMIGTELVAKAEPDGYTLLGHTSGYPATAAIRKKLPFDPARSLLPVAMIARAPLVLAVHPSVPARSVKELVALAKNHPGKLNYSSAGTGGNNHFAASLFASATGIKLTHIPYKGVAQAAIALVSGEVEILFASSPAISPQLKAGRLRALGVTSLHPSPLMPELPALAQSGVPGYNYELWWALFAPAGIPPDRTNVINAAVAKILAGAEMRKFLSNDGAAPWPLSLEQLSDLLPKEIERYRKIAQAAGIEPE